MAMVIALTLPFFQVLPKEKLVSQHPDCLFLTCLETGKMIQIEYTVLRLGNVSVLTTPNFYDAFWQSVYLLGFSRFLTIYSLVKNREAVF